ncbi:armadillo-type protein [Dipodascopsis tothii]|uniref:armadillo-type protein n=1 Tax=Dipodascopsis tothii TaxID=44089 RepID=UPI0034CFFC1D
MATNSATYAAVQPLLDRLSSEDSDFRFMSLNDLHGLLANPGTHLTDGNTTSRIIDAIYRSLSDRNAEVQNLAVRCLAPLVGRLNDGQTTTLLGRLAGLVASDSPEDVSIALTALRTVITNVPVTATNGRLFVGYLLPTLLPRLRNSSDSVDVLVDLVRRFGPALEPAQVDDTLRALIEILETGKGLVRKRAIGAVGALTPYLDAALWQRTMDYLAGAFAGRLADDKLRTMVAVCGTLCRADPARTGPHLGTLTPHVLGALEADEDSCEAALVTLDTFAALCPTAMAAFTAEIVATARRFVRYDPNYAVDDDDAYGDDDEQMEDAESSDDEFDDGMFSDDDDGSWKLRRSAAKLLATFVDTRPDLLASLYAQTGSLLVARFGEREETVRTEVMATFTVLVRKTGAAAAPASPRRGRNKRRMTDDGDAPGAVDPRAALAGLLPTVFKLLARHFRKPANVPTKQAALALATELAAVLGAAVPEHLAEFVPLLEASMRSTNALRSAIIVFVSTVVRHAPLAAVQAYLPAFATILETGADDKFYKVSSEALAVALELVELVASGDGDHAALLVGLHDTAAAKIVSAEVDLEVRERAMLVVSKVLAQSRALTPEQAANDLAVLLDRLRSEITRPVAIRCVDTIALADATVDPAWTNAVVAELVALLHKASRVLRTSAVVALRAVCASDRLRGQIAPDVAAETVTVVKTVVVADDSQVQANGLAILAALAPAAGPAVFDASVVRLVATTGGLAAQPLAEQVVQLAGAAAAAGGPTAAATIYDSIVDAAEGDLVAGATAGALARVIHAGGLADRQAALEATVAADATEAVCGPLAVVAELARLAPVAVPADAVYAKFDSPSAKVQTAAAHALGALAARDLDTLPHALALLEAARGRAVLLHLAALKETIAQAGELGRHADSVWALLYSLDLAAEDDGSRSMAAECLGRLAVSSLDHYMPEIERKLRDDSDIVRSVTISALRYILADETAWQADSVRAVMLTFFTLLTDASAANRRLVLTVLTATLHTHPLLVTPYEASLLPLLFAETNVRPELVREVQMGPFKHRVDDGLDGRKAAYEALHALLTAGSATVALDDVCARALAGLDDDHEIKVLSCLILTALARQAPATVAAAIDVLATKFTAIGTVKLKDNAIKQEIEKQGEAVRRIASTTAAVQDAIAVAAPPADKAQAWARYVREVYSKLPQQ